MFARMKERTGYRYRLYPTSGQGQALSRWAGCARAIWNAALEQRRTAWRMHRQRVTWAAQDAELAAAKREHPWLAEPHSDVCQQTLRDLDRAFARFLRGDARYPRFKRKRRRESFRIQSRRGKAEIAVRRLTRRWGEVRVPKLGWVRFRWSRKPKGEIKHLTISRDALGWHLSLCCERQSVPVPMNPGPPIGLDRGVAATVALSTGELRSCPGLPPGQTERLRRLQRRAGRQVTLGRRRSARHVRTLFATAKLRAREARIRKDFLHKLSTEIAKNHGVIAIERLDVAGMTRSAAGTVTEPGKGVAQKRALNRGIRAQGWGELRRQLAYKAVRAGGLLVEVQAAYSSQTCARCGHREAASRDRRRFSCTNCGHADHADTNAALVILARALERQEDGGRTGSSQHGEPSAQAGHRTVNHPEALAA